MTQRRVCFGLLIALLPVLPGCGYYTITFEVADVINDGGLGDSAREQLDVDVLCLTKKDAAEHPEIVSGTMRARDWFEKRDADDARLGTIDRSHIYSLRPGKTGDRKDTLAGPPLLSYIDSKKREIEMKIRHTQALNADSAIVIYGRFRDATGIARTEPVVIKPPPAWQNRIRIKVGRTNMEYVKP